MNNWHLLLALVAVFQPIESFTERNLVDGRQQCCDRRTDTLVRDARSSLYDSDQLTKAPTPLRRLKDRDEIHEDRRAELRQRDIVFARRSTERSLFDIRERDTRRIPSILIRSTRVEYRPERLSLGLYRERRVDVQRRERYARNTRDIKPEEQTRRILNRITRDSVMRNDDRTYESLARNSLSQNDVRPSRFSYERLAKDSDSRSERMQTRSEELRRLATTQNAAENFRRLTSTRDARDSLRRITLTRDARDNLRQTREDMVRGVEDSNGNRQRVNIVRRETLSRVDVRRHLDNSNERDREQERLAGERRALSDNSRVAERIRDIRIRENVRDVRRDNRDRVSANRRLMTERSEERRQQSDDLRQSRERMTENSDRKLSRERVLLDRRDIRESRLNNDINIRVNRAVESQRDIRYSKRQARDNSDERRVVSRDSISMSSLERDNQVTDRRARSLDIQNFRNTRAELKLTEETQRDIRYSERQARDTRDERTRDVSRENRRISSLERDNRITNQRARSLDARNFRNTRAEPKLTQESRRDIRYSERQTGENRDERRDVSRESRRMFSVERDNRVTDRRSRSLDARNFRNTRAEPKLTQESRRDIRYSERQTGENRDERRDVSRESRRMFSVERDNRVTDRRSRSLDARNFRNTRAEPKLHQESRRDIRYSERQTRENRDERRDLSRESRRTASLERDNRVTDRRMQVADVVRGLDVSRKQVQYRNKMETRDRDAIDTRFRNVDSRTRDTMDNNVEDVNQAAITNWQYIFYTLQAIYLCGLFMQMMSPKRFEKSKMTNLHWWPITSERLIKVD